MFFKSYVVAYYYVKKYCPSSAIRATNGGYLVVDKQESVNAFRRRTMDYQI